MKANLTGMGLVLERSELMGHRCLSHLGVSPNEAYNLCLLWIHSNQTSQERAAYGKEVLLSSAGLLPFYSNS